MNTKASKFKKCGSTHMYIREIVTLYKTLDTKRIKITDPKAVANFIRSQIGDQNREHFSILCMNNKNEIVSYHNVSIGTVKERIVHPRELFTAAVITGASGIIITHNHPSGNVKPSKEDLKTTERIIEGSKIMGIPLLDHIIVGFNTEEFYSIKENRDIIW